MKEDAMFSLYYSIHVRLVFRRGWDGYMHSVNWPGIGNKEWPQDIAIRQF